MKLLSIELKNYKSVKNEKVDLSNMSLASVTGENGTGKSSIFSSVMWVLTGKHDYATDNELITLQEESMQGILLLEVMPGYNPLKIIRSKDRSSKSSKLQLFDGDKKITGDSISETQEKINNFLNFNYETFINSAFIKQDEFDSFFKETPAKRDAIFMKFLDIEKYTKYGDKAKAKRNTIEMDFTYTTNRINSLKNMIVDGYDIDAAIADCNKSISALQLEIKPVEKELEDSIRKESEFQSYVQNRSQNERTKSNMLSEVEDIKRQLRTKKNEYSVGLNEFDNKVQWDEWAKLDTKKLCSDISAKMDEIKKNGIVFKTKKEEAESKKSNMNAIEGKNGKCWVCGNELSKDELTAMVKELDVQIADCNAQYLDCKARYSILEGELSGWQRVDVYTFISDLEKRVFNKEKEVKEFINNLPKFDDNQDKELQNILKIQGQASNRKDELNSTLTGLQLKLGSLNKQKENDLSNKLELVDLNIQVEALKKEMSIYDELIKAFSKKGIPSLIINNSIPAIEMEANRLLEKFGSDMRFEFRREDDKNESLEIYARDWRGERKIYMYSGGEKLRLALALRIALSRFLMLKNGAKIGLLVIDEPGGLDGKGLDGLIESLKTLSDEYNQIFVISHIENLMKAFPQSIFVYDDGVQGSKVEVKN